MKKTARATLIGAFGIIFTLAGAATAAAAPPPGGGWIYINDYGDWSDCYVAKANQLAAGWKRAECTAAEDWYHDADLWVRNY